MFILKEFSNELECLHREVLPELQQYFMQYGYDFSFVDFNLNLEFDPFLDPNLFDCMLNELDDCYRVSDGCFFLVRAKLIYLFLKANKFKVNIYHRPYSEINMERRRYLPSSILTKSKSFAVYLLIKVI